MSSFAAGGLASESVAGTGAPWLARAGLQLDMHAWTGQLQARFGASRSQNDFVGLEQRTLGLELVGLHTWDVGPAALSLGLGVGADWIHQEFTTRGSAPERDAIAPFVGPRAQAAWSILPWFGVYAGGGVDLSFSTQQDDAGAPSELRYTLVPGAHAGVSVAFF